MKHERVQLFDIEIDPVRMPEAVDRLTGWIHDGDGGHRYVVTPNTDHVVMLRENAALRDAYRDAALVVADGMPVVLASRLLRKRLPERVTGADLVPALFAAATPEKPITTFLLGAGPGVAERAAATIRSNWPNVNVVGTYSPPMGFEHDDDENCRILDMVNAAKPDALVVGLGAPKQELWVHRFHNEIDAKVSFCVGATIDFLAGEVRRAPNWMQRCGLEWFYRMMSQPRRLVKRYARDAWIFPQLLWREWRRPRRATP